MVVVSAGDVRVPDDVDKVRVVVENTMAGSPDLPLCTGGAGDCLSLPIVATLVPGPDHPTDLVTVNVTAYRQGQPVIRDAASFVFQSGQRRPARFRPLRGVPRQARLRRLDAASGLRQQRQMCRGRGHPARRRSALRRRYHRSR